jgi:hypothetical protein
VRFGQGHRHHRPGGVVALDVDDPATPSSHRPRGGGVPAAELLGADAALLGLIALVYNLACWIARRRS